MSMMDMNYTLLRHACLVVNHFCLLDGQIGSATTANGE